MPEPARDVARLNTEIATLRAELDRCECRSAVWFHQNAAIDEAIRREHASLKGEARRVLRFNSANVLARLEGLLRMLH